VDAVPQFATDDRRVFGLPATLNSERPGGNVIRAGIEFDSERAPGESVFVAAIPRTSTEQGDALLAVNGQPLLLVGRQALPYPPGRIRLNGQIEPAVVAGDLTIAWAHRDRTQQTAYLVQQGEADIGPEAGVSYTVRIFDRNDTLVHTATGITGNSFVWDVASAAVDAGALGDQITLEITSVRDGLESWQPQTRHLMRAGYGLHYGNYYGGL